QPTFRQIDETAPESRDWLIHNRRRDGDDVPGFLKAHLRCCELRYVEESPEISFISSAKIFRGVLGKGLGNEHPRIVYQQVDSSEIEDSRVHYLLRYVVTSDIAVDQLQAVFARQHFRPRDISRVCYHVVARLEEPFRDSAANAS